MNKVQLILNALKPKAKSLGFSSKELQEVAEALAQNLPVTDESTDEDVNVAVEAAVGAVLPILGMGQKQANRLLERYKANHPEPTDKPDDNKPNDKPQDTDKPADTKPQDTPDNKPTDNPFADTMKQMAEQMASMKKLFDEQMKASSKQAKAMEAQLKAMKDDKVKALRQKQLEEILKDSGKFGEKVLKNYGRMNFDLESDDDFNEFITDTKESLEDIKQQIADESLRNNSRPGSGSGEPNDKEPFSDDEIDSLANGMV